MRSALITTKIIISSVIVFAVCLFGCVFDAQAKLAAIANSPVRLKLVSVENETEGLEFQVFFGGDLEAFTVFPQSSFKLLPYQALDLSSKDLLVLKCCKGAYLPVFIQDGGLASGVAPEGFDGPFYISMWLQSPYVASSSKVRVRYGVKRGSIGSVGIKIGKNGDYRFVAYDGVQFIA